MSWRSRSLCLPVLVAAGLGCVTGLAISGGGPTQIGVVRAAGTQTLAYPLPKPSAAAKAAPTTTTTKATSTRTVATAGTTKPKKSSASKVKGYPLPKPKAGSGSAAKTTGGGSKASAGFSLEGPRGPAGPAGVAGPAGPAGPQGTVGPVSNVVKSLTINWRDGVSVADPTATVPLPGLGTATLACTAAAQTLTFTPASTGARTVVDADTAQGAGTQGATSFVSSASQGSPITLPVPNNGMIFATISIQPATGNGGPGPDPASVTLSSQWKLNDPNPVNNFCFIAAQFVGKP
jgi:hypothetical protein